MRVIDASITVDKSASDYDSIHNTFLRVWDPSTDPTKEWRKPGDQPIAIITCEQRQKLFDEVEAEVGRRYRDQKSEEAKKTWLKEASEVARKHGHAQYKPPIFGIFIFDMCSFCALHCKTTKVQDLLVHGASLMSLWDSKNGNHIVSLRNQSAILGPALTSYFDLIEAAPEYKGQLASWCSDHSDNMLGTAATRANRDINTDFKRLSKMLDALAEKGKVKTRLIGIMANVVLAKPWIYFKVLKESLGKHAATTALKKREKKQYDLGISILTCELFLLKEMILLLSLTSYDKKEIREMAKRYRLRAKQYEFVHAYFLPNMSRMYDVVLTCIVPHIFDRCIELGVSPGVLGLLESREQFHQRVNQCPSMPFSLYKAIALGRKSWCFQVAECLNLLCYKETREDTRTSFPSETRQVVREGKQRNNVRGQGGNKGKERQQISYIYDPLETPFLQKTSRCGCGRYKTFDACNVCSWGYIEDIWKKSEQSATLLIKRETTVSKTTTTISNEKQEIKSLLKFYAELDKMNILRFLNADFNKHDNA